MSATPAMTTIAVRPYHQVFVRERLAERTAARLRFARESLGTASRLAAAAAITGCMPGMFGHRHGTSDGQVNRREREQYRGRAGEPLPSEPPRRPMVLDEHAVRRTRGARTLDVGDRTGRLVRDVVSRHPQAPAELEVLHVHEVALVPTARGTQRAASQPDRG